VLVLLNFAIATWGQYLKTEKDYSDWKLHAQNEQKIAAQKIAAGCRKVLKRTESLESCLAHQVKSYENQANIDQDLKAQRDMVWWAKLGFFTTFVSTAVGAVGLLFLWSSLKQTREAISIDRDVGHAQVRAYLSVEVPKNEDLIVEEGFKVELLIKNTGQSPARNVNHIAGIVIWPQPLKSGDGFPIIVEPSVGSVGVSLASGESIVIDAVMAKNITVKDVVEAMRTGDKPIYLCSWVFYKDVFGKDRQVWFCAELLKNGKSKIIKGTAYPLFSWTIARTHNQAD
jgi:hypothetical protein